MVINNGYQLVVIHHQVKSLEVVWIQLFVFGNRKQSNVIILQGISIDFRYIKR